MLTPVVLRVTGPMFLSGGIPTALHLFQCSTHLAAWIIFIQVLLKDMEKCALFCLQFITLSLIASGNVSKIQREK